MSFSGSSHLHEMQRLTSAYKSLLPLDQETLPWKHFCEFFQALGLDIDNDVRFQEMLDAWCKAGKPEYLDLSGFTELAHHAFSLIKKATQRQLIIPEFSDFSNEIEQIFLKVKDNEQGKVADYIPQLKQVSPEKYAVAVCTVDGQRLAFGDADDMFCVQSTCKPVSYCIALEEVGESKVHQHVGREPSGHTFNELSLNRQWLPHNPMINAGAIMTSALIRPDLTRADRFEYVVNMWSKLMAGQRPGFSNTVYLSERETADRNFALGYFMREHNAFPEGTNLLDTLEFYFQCCSLEVNVRMMSILASTFANGGVCPFTSKQVLSPDTVQRCLSLMYSCGMYDFSGEWAFSIGLPAKSGVSGVIMVVVPNVMGFCIWSPRLDDNSNSVRGIEFCRELLKKYNFHNFDHLLEGSVHQKTDPRCIKIEEKSQRNATLLWACSTNQISEIKSFIAKGIDLSEADYDGRTGLHLAASEGHLDVVKLLASMGVSLTARDRWGGTPLDDAKRENHQEVIAWLEEHLA